MPTESGHCNSSVVNHKIYAIRMFFFQKRSKVIDAFGIGDIELMVPNGCLATIFSEDFSPFELGVAVNVLQCLFASALISCGQVDEQRPVVEGRLWILKSEVSDDAKADALYFIV